MSAEILGVVNITHNYANHNAEQEGLWDETCKQRVLGVVNTTHLLITILNKRVCGMKRVS